MITRRQFLKSGVSMAGIFTTNLWPQVSATTAQANDRIGVGVIGLGIMGRFHLKHLLRNSQNWEIQIIAACDVFNLLNDNATSLAAAEGQNIITYNDFRDLLLRKDIDAVFIATPDHWHAIQTIEACKAGKDVYVQKPISVDTRESRMMVEAVRKYHRICQVGTQQPSWNNFRKAIAIIRSGILGKIAEVKTFIYGFNIFPGPYNAPTSTPPSDLDWDLWLGPAAHPLGFTGQYNDDIFGVDFGMDQSPKSIYGDPVKVGGRAIYQRGTWRLFKPSGGLQTDWGIHLTDIVLRAMRVDGPRAVSSHGGNFIYSDKRELPDSQITIWEFPDFLCTFELRSGNNFTFEGLPDKFDRSHGILFFGTDATLFVNRSGYVVIPLPNKNLDLLPTIEIKNKDGTRENLILESNGTYDGRGDDAHVKDFLDCVRSRQDPIATIENGRYATDMCIAAMAAYWTRKTLDWNPATGTTGETVAHPYLNLRYREPWKLEI